MSVNELPELTMGMNVSHVAPNVLVVVGTQDIFLRKDYFQCKELNSKLASNQVKRIRI